MHQIINANRDKWWDVRTEYTQDFLCTQRFPTFHTFKVNQKTLPPKSAHQFAWTRCSAPKSILAETATITIYPYCSAKGLSFNIDSNRGNLSPYVLAIESELLISAMRHQHTASAPLKNPEWNTRSFTEMEFLLFLWRLFFGSVRVSLFIRWFRHIHLCMCACCFDMTHSARKFIY